MAKILILGGTTEARELAESLTSDHDVITSLAGRTRTPDQGYGTLRVGGFGGAEGLAAYLAAEEVEAVVDATHPFSVRISANARAACDKAGVPRLMLIRPAWSLPESANVTTFPSPDAVAAALPDLAKRAFLTVGRDSLSAYSDVSGVWFLVRVLETPDGPLPLRDYGVVTDRPPFVEEDERALIREHAIDCLVAKNAGGTATQAKITAALAEGIRIVLIDRPPVEPGDAVAAVSDGEVWIRRTFSA